MSLIDYIKSGKFLSLSGFFSKFSSDSPDVTETFEKGELEEAERLYRDVLRKQPRHSKSFYLLGVIAHQAGDDIDALKLVKRAIELSPEKPDFYSGCGEIYFALGDCESAVDYFKKALGLKPDFIQAYYNLGKIYKKLGNLSEAAKNYKQAFELKPGSAELAFELGDILHDQGRYQESVAAFERAIELNPQHIKAYNNLGILYSDSGRLSEARECYKKVLEINPDVFEAYNNMGNIYKDMGSHEKALEQYEKALSLSPDYADANSNYLLCLNYQTEITQEDIFNAHKKWGLQRLSHLDITQPAYKNTFNPDRRLRIGYVSPDFRNHSVARFIEPVFANHNKDKFEIYAYSNSLQSDGFTERFKSVTDHWRDITFKNDEDAAEIIHEDNIDILIDLAGHTARNRLSVFFFRPAPLQLTYLGYPATTGLPAIQYRLTDTWADPPEISDQYYTETLIRLPHGFLCYQPPDENIDITELPGLTEPVTFGCFNNYAKINLPLIKLWSSILKQLPESRLLLKASQFRDAELCESVLHYFEEQGINISRVELVRLVESFEDHMSLYNKVDIALDTYPYNGTTTTCEALWMGIPVISLAGNSHHSRVGVSILSATGLPEFIAESPDNYVGIALSLANDKTKLSDYRKNIRGKVRKSSLTDARQFTLDLEQVYSDIWKKLCESGNKQQ